MARLNTQRLEALVAIADHGGVTSAARAMGVAQSTVSASLQALEGEYGVILVDRSGRSATLTAAGETLVEYARSLLALASEAADRVARLRAAPVEGVLHVGGTTTATLRMLPSLLRSFAERYPAVDVDLRVDTTDGIVDAVAHGKVPLALVAADVDRPAFATLVAGTETQVVIAAGDHPLAGQHVRPSELRGSRFLLREEGSETRRRQLGMLDAWRIPGIRTSTVASTSAIIGAVAHGIGISCLPRIAAEPMLTLGQVCELHLDPAPEPRPIHLIRRSDRPLTVVEELFLERVQEEGTT